MCTGSNLYVTTNIFQAATMGLLPQSHGFRESELVANKTWSSTINPVSNPWVRTSSHCRDTGESKQETWVFKKKQKPSTIYGQSQTHSATKFSSIINICKHTCKHIWAQVQKRSFLTLGHLDSVLYWIIHILTFRESKHRPLVNSQFMADKSFSTFRH